MPLCLAAVSCCHSVAAHEVSRKHSAPREPGGCGWASPRHCFCLAVCRCSNGQNGATGTQRATLSLPKRLTRALRAAWVGTSRAWQHVVLLASTYQGLALPIGALFAIVCSTFWSALITGGVAVYAQT